MIGELEDAKWLCTTSNSVHNIMVEWEKWEIHQSKNQLCSLNLKRVSSPSNKPDIYQYQMSNSVSHDFLGWSWIIKESVMAERLEKQNLWLEGRWSHQQINKNFGWPLLVSTLITIIEGPVSKDPMSKAPKALTGPMGTPQTTVPSRCS